jgi:hypothetical protein
MYVVQPDNIFFTFVKGVARVRVYTDSQPIFFTFVMGVAHVCIQTHNLFLPL